MVVNIVLPELSRAPIGGHKVVYEYANRFTDQGNTVSVFYFLGNRLKNKHIPQFARRMIVCGYTMLVGPRKWFPLNRKIRTKTINSIKEIGVGDILIATGVETANPVFSADISKGKKVYLIQDFEKWVYQEKDVVDTYSLGMNNFVVSEWLKQIVDCYSVKPSSLVPNGIDTNVFKNMEMSRNKHSIVFHYRSAEHKGCINTLKVIEQLEEKYCDLLVNVISNEDKPLDFIKCNYFQNVSAKEVAKINNESKVFLCSTIEEGFGLPGLEAMACGCAVISTEYNGVKEYAINGYNSLLSPVGDVDAMVDNVCNMFEDEELYKKITSNGITTGKNKSISESFKLFDELIHSMI